MLNKANYIDEFFSLIYEFSKFKIIKVDTFNHILKIEIKVNNYIWKVKFFNATLSTSNLYIFDNLPYFIFSLLKIPKPNVPLIPTLPVINSPTYKLAKFLSTASKLELRMTIQFPIVSISLTKLNICLLNIFMTNFEVESLYTYILVSETVNIKTYPIFNSISSFNLDPSLNLNIDFTN